VAKLSRPLTLFGNFRYTQNARLCEKSEKCENKNFFSHFALYFTGYLGFGCYFSAISLVFFPLLKFAEGFHTV